MIAAASKPPIPMNPGEITVVSRGRGRLHVRFMSGVKVSDSARLFANIGELAKAERATEVLIDASVIQERLSLLRRLQMIMAFVAHLRGLRIAGVLSEITIDPKRIGETMARNRGANVKVFTHLSEAIAWLEWEEPN